MMDAHTLIENWLIEGVTVTESEHRLHSELLALDEAFCVATGTEWLGHNVNEAPVIYVATEDAIELNSRISAWLDSRLEARMWGGDCCVIQHATELHSDGLLGAEIEQRAQGCKNPPRLIVIPAELLSGENDEPADQKLTLEYLTNRFDGAAINVVATDPDLADRIRRRSGVAADRALWTADGQLVLGAYKPGGHTPPDLHLTLEPVLDSAVLALAERA